MSLKFCIGILSGVLVFRYFSYCFAKKPVMATGIEEKRILLKSLNPYNLHFDPTILDKYLYIPKKLKTVDYAKFDHITTLYNFVNTHRNNPNLTPTFQETQAQFINFLTQNQFV